MDLEEGGLWRNWVGNQYCVSQYRAAPTTEAELVELVQEAGKRDLAMRVAGSGHSFTPVVATNGLLLSLEGPRGVQHVDRARKQITVAAGTRINEVGKTLKGMGLSLINQGDIDSQAVAGAFTTGTHGTGLKLGNLASSIAGMRLVLASGEILDIDGSDRDMLYAAQVAIGTLGVISSMTLNVMDAYNLHEKLWRDDFETCMERHDELAANHRHFGFFWCPVQESRHLYCLPDTSAVSSTSKIADVCEMKVLDITDAPPMQSEFEKIAYSSEVYPIEYVPNFVELEYAVPLEHGKESIRAIRELMLTKHTNCIYPIEYRFTAGDPAWMSPFYKQDSITLSVSGGPGIDYWAFLRDTDQILRRYNSRPHWGKMHFLNSSDVTKLYPRARDFRDLRRQLDPQGRFLKRSSENAIRLTVGAITRDASRRWSNAEIAGLPLSNNRRIGCRTDWIRRRRPLSAAAQRFPHHCPLPYMSCGYIPASMTTTHCYCIELRTAARKTSTIYDEALAPLGINIAQYSLLKKIRQAGQLSLTELAKLSDLDRSTIGRNVKVLERMDLVRTVSGKDQREASVELTDEGKERLKASIPAWNMAQTKIEEMLGGSDAARQLHSLLLSF